MRKKGSHKEGLVLEEPKKPGLYLGRRAWVFASVRYRSLGLSVSDGTSLAPRETTWSQVLLLWVVLAYESLWLHHTPVQDGGHWPQVRVMLDTWDESYTGRCEPLSPALGGSQNLVHSVRLDPMLEMCRAVGYTA